MTFAAGDLVSPNKLNVYRLPLTSGTITKGQLVRVVGGNTVLLATATSTEAGVYVALETRVFAAGSVTDVECAGAGAKVVCLMGGVVAPQGYVKIETGSNEVIAGTALNFAAGFVVGRYQNHPQESVVTATVDTDLGVILLGAS